MSQNSDRLALYLAAEQQILAGAQSVEVADRKLTRANLQDIRHEIARLTALVSSETTGAGAQSGFKAASFASSRSC